MVTVAVTVIVGFMALKLNNQPDSDGKTSRNVGLQCVSHLVEVSPGVVARIASVSTEVFIIVDVIVVVVGGRGGKNSTTNQLRPNPLH